ncbi:MAG: transporter transrane protein [Firmicutes bacterium]|nr:transporter transrane protein [Bacillota bacterium]
MSAASYYPKFRWFVLLALWFITVTEGIILISFAPLIGVIASQLGLSLGEATGAFMGAFTLFVTVGAVAGGAFVDRVGAVPVFIASCVLMFLGDILIPTFSDSFPALVALRIIEGVGAGAIMGVGSAVAAVWFPEAERGLVLGIQGLSVSLGIAIGFGTVPAVFEATGSWTTAMAWLAVAPVIGLLLSMVVAFGPKPPAEDSSVAACDLSSSSDFKLALKQPVTYIGILCIFFLSWIMQAFNDLTPAYLAINPPIGIGYGPVAAGKYMMVVQIAFMIGSVVGSLAMQKIFKGVVKPVVMIGFIMAGIFCLSIKFPFVHGNPVVLVPFLFIAGFFQGWVNPNVQAFCAMHYPAHIVGKLGGMWMGLGILGGTAGVVAGSVALHTTGAYQVSIIIVALIAVVGVGCTVFLNPPKVFCSGNK